MRILPPVLLLSLLFTAEAAAHPQFTSTGNNRYLKVTLVGGGALRFAYTVMFGEIPALAARKRADANADGVVDDDEQRLAGQALEQAVTRGLLVEVDGAKRSLVWEPPAVGFSADKRVGPIPFSIDLVGRLDGGGGVHTVRVDDTTPLDALAETEIRVEEGPGARVVAGWQGRADEGRVTRFLYQGPKYSSLEDRSIGFRYDDASAAAAGTGRGRGLRLPLGLGGVLVAALLCGGVILRRRRKT